MPSGTMRITRTTEKVKIHKTLKRILPLRKIFQMVRMTKTVISMKIAKISLIIQSLMRIPNNHGLQKVKEIQKCH